MTRNSEQRRVKAFAKRADEVVNAAQRAIDTFLLHLVRNEDSVDEFAVNVAVVAFLASFEDLIITGTNELNLFALRQFKELADVVPSVNLVEQRMLIESVRTELARKIESLRLQSEQTGIAVNKSAPTQMLSARKVNEIRMSLDAITVRTAQRGVFTAGIGVLETKKSVALIDDVTTDLCRNRMNGQVRPWQDYFVDPLTNARWLYPPFIGSTLSAKEIFHYCRTMIVSV